MKSPSKEDSFDTHHDHNQLKKIRGLLGQGLKFKWFSG
jgi:hypothetical protein